MSESSAESAAPNLLWDVVRYIIVAVAAGLLIYYYGFYTPTVYISREHTGKTMGTDYIVKVSQIPENENWQKIADEIQERLDALEQMMSTFRQNSEVSQFNTSTSAEDWFSVSKEIAQLVQTSLELSQLTEGAFDITIAPLVRHWGFGAGASPQLVGTFEELSSTAALLKERTGYEKLSVRLDPPALKKEISELTIDFSGIAKGFAVDCIAELLDAHNITDYLIEVGGETRSKGKRSPERDWIVGIEKPTIQFSGAQQAFPLKNQSLATSGSYLQVRQIDGQQVSHLIDPRTGLPAQIGRAGTDELVSAAVLAPNCTRADALATAMFVLGEQKGLELANRHKIAVLFLLKTGDEIRESPSDYWTKQEIR